MTKYIFIDTETTGLSEDRETWEWALIEENGTEHVFMCWVNNPRDIERDAARVNHIFDRSPQWNNQLIHPLWGMPGDEDHTMNALADRLWSLTRDATLVGICPDFDRDNLKALLEYEGYVPMWKHGLVDARTLAQGFELGSQTLIPIPNSTQSRKYPSWEEVHDRYFDLLGVPRKDMHTALGDARYARDLFARVRMLSS